MGKHPDAVESMVYEGSESTVELRGNSSASLDFAAPGDLRRVSWAPVDQRAMTIEIRVRVLNVRTQYMGEGTAVPAIFWRAQTSHGKTVWTDPPLTQPVHVYESAALAMPPGSYPERPVQLNAVPVRGMALRVTTREFSLELSTAPDPLVLPFTEYPRVTVGVSIMPVSGVAVAVYPQQTYYSNQAFALDGGGLSAVGRLAVFPTEAQEFRIRDEHGLPLTTGVLEFVDPRGDTLGYKDLADYGDWNPIPFGAFGYRSAVEYGDGGRSFAAYFR